MKFIAGNDLPIEHLLDQAVPVMKGNDLEMGQIFLLQIEIEKV